MEVIEVTKSVNYGGSCDRIKSVNYGGKPGGGNHPKTLQLFQLQLIFIILAVCSIGSCFVEIIFQCRRICSKLCVMYFYLARIIYT